MSSPQSRRLADVEARLNAIERELVLLRACRAPRDEQDRHLRHTLAERTEGRSFNAAALLAHAAVDPELRRALEDACIQSAQEVGAWLRDHAGTHDGIAIVRLRRRQWRVVHVEHVRVSG